MTRSSPPSEAKSAAQATVQVNLELYGVARLVCGRREARVTVPERADLEDLTSALAEACPALVGKVIRDDRSGLLESHIFNVNGTTFVGDGPLHLKQGDSVLLFSSQAGG